MASKRIPTPSGLVQGENRNLSAIPTLIVLPWYHKYTLFVKRESCCPVWLIMSRSEAMTDKISSSGMGTADSILLIFVRVRSAKASNYLPTA